MAKLFLGFIKPVISLSLNKQKPSVKNPNNQIIRSSCMISKLQAYLNERNTT